MERVVRLEGGVKSHVRSAESHVRVRVERGREGRGEGFPGGLRETGSEEVRGYWGTMTRPVSGRRGRVGQQARVAGLARRVF